MWKSQQYGTENKVNITIIKNIYNYTARGKTFCASFGRRELPRERIYAIIMCAGVFFADRISIAVRA